jgi:hypothetical protein
VAGQDWLSGWRASQLSAAAASNDGGASPLAGASRSSSAIMVSARALAPALLGEVAHVLAVLEDKANKLTRLQVRAEECVGATYG